MGISGSGKSTLCDILYGGIPHVRLNIDAIRKELCGGEEDHSKHVECIRTLQIRLRDALRYDDGRLIVMDNTNTLYEDRRGVYLMIEQVGLVVGVDVEILLLHINVTPQEAWARQMSRTRSVPMYAIERQYLRLQRELDMECLKDIPHTRITIDNHGIFGNTVRGL
jgi:predicted kinase